jgi:hypothetical protein
MSTRTLYDNVEDVAVLYDSVTGTAFGPLIRPTTQCIDPVEVAEAFLGSLAMDARSLADTELRDLYRAWRQQADEDYDPTPWCSGCGAMKRAQCDCGPIAEND